MSDPLLTMVVTVQARLPGPRDRVFALLTDVERMAGLGPEHVGARWTDHERGVGATFVGRNSSGGRVWEVPCTVVLFDPPSAFGWTVGDPADPTAHWAYALTADDDATQVVQTFRHGVGRSFLRAAVDKHPDRAAELTAGRSRDLATNMRTVLLRAADLLG